MGAQQPTLQTLISHWRCEINHVSRGGPLFLLGGGPLTKGPRFHLYELKKNHFRCGLAPRFGCLRCESMCRTGNVATFTLRSLLR